MNKIKKHERKVRSEMYIILYFEQENYTPVEKKRKENKGKGIEFI